MRIAILWSALSGYLNACLRELAGRKGITTFVSHMRPSSEAPYEEALFDWIDERHQWEGEVEPEALLQRLEQFRPDLILCANWHYRGYRQAMRRFKGSATRLFTSDRQWLGTLRQRVGVLVSPIYLHPLCEGIFVAGDPQVEWARRMGFRPEEIITGVLTCDHEKFTPVSRLRREAPEMRAFAYVGRFVECKGLDILTQAYRQYREATRDPWPLRCYGTGPLRGLLEGIEGVEVKPFCQPDELPLELGRANCLVLASTFDSWGLVVHEAAAAGMAVIVSDAVGASAQLVREGYNGYVVKTGDAAVLSGAMLRYCALSEEERREMGERSHRLSWQFTPSHWANNLLAGAEKLRTHPGAGR